MYLEHYSEKRLKAEIRAIFGRYVDLNLYRVFLFGSRVRGSHSERSDIDIGIEGSREIPSELLVEISEELENLPTLYSFDVVDFRNASPGFKKEALKYAETIN